MADYIEHITREGERWDSIAYRYYGDASLITPLAEANETVRLLPVLPGGLVLIVPLLDAGNPPITENLPPWKR
jgi:phage tail protein X